MPVEIFSVLRLRQKKYNRLPLDGATRITLESPGKATPFLPRPRRREKKGERMKKLKTLKMKRTSGTAISYDVKMKVFQRDRGRCVVCGSLYNVEANAHFIPASEGGLGIEENIVTLCNHQSQNKCHVKFDFGTDEERETIRNIIQEHLLKHYPKWSRDKVELKKRGE